MFIIDKGDVANSRTTKNTGTGLENTKARLSLLYGNKHNFTMNVTDSKTEIEFWITGKNETEIN